MTLLYLFFSIALLIIGHFILIPRSLRYYSLEFFNFCPLPNHLRAISLRYFIYSLGGVALGALQFPLSSLPLIALFVTLFSATIIFDLDLEIIPDWIHWLGIPAAVIAVFLMPHESFLSRSIAIILPFGLLAFNFVCAKFNLVEGLGRGDIKLLIWLSLLAGPSIYAVFFLAVVIGLLQNMHRLLRMRSETFPFGPSIIYAFILFFTNDSLWVNSSKFHY
ncbi:MAG: hypothetical protein A2X86_20165 [Bdellovibrionales bacterium GWA2_49_15]|nr:MAG: hypothetical protein A2X86_20165 [Bdellovibrionales bacterium GWA2_49_15]HAZ11372.1 hypothetical protein [Bdellovibrionales bacterium]